MTQLIKELQKGRINMEIEDEIKEEQLSACAEMGFSEEQMKVIRQCIDYEIYDEQLELIADKRFSCEQMEKISDDIYSGISCEHIKLYANPVFNLQQMREISNRPFELNYDQVKLYADPKFSAEQMAVIKKGLVNKFSHEQIEEFLNPCIPLKELEETYEKFLAENKAKRDKHIKEVNELFDRIMNS